MTSLIAPLISLFISGIQPASSPKNEESSPLADFSIEWNDPRYQVCNTARDAGYMNEDEKNVIYILNLARYNPRLFAATVIKKYPE